MLHRTGSLTKLFVLIVISIAMVLPFGSRSAAGQPADQPGLANTASAGLETFGELKLITPADLSSGDQFGRSTIISDTLLIGASVRDNDNGTDSGSVYIFDKAAGGPNSWGQVKKLTASDGSSGDNFGVGIDLSGDTLIVGAHDDNTGSVYVFEKNLGGANNWGQRTKITPPDGAANDRFGWSVDLEGDTLVVGALWDDNTCAAACDDSGSIYIFERDQGGLDNWGFVKKMFPNDLDDQDLFGRAVLISGDTVFASAGTFGEFEYDLVGRVYVYERNEGGANNWGLHKTLAASDGFVNNNFGFSLAIYEDILLIGARNDSEAGADTGSLYLLERNAGGQDNWGETAKLTAPDAQSGDNLGRYVAIHGDTLVATADMEDSAGTNAGAAYVFSRQLEGTDSWDFESKLIGSAVGANDLSGAWTSIWGEYLAIGAHRGNAGGSESGEIYLFQRGVQPPSMEGIFIPIVNNCKLLYFDDFSNPNSGWPVAQAGSNLYEYRNGEYRVRVGNPFSLAGAIPGAAFSNYLLTTDVRNITNRAGSYGLLFGQVPGFVGLYTFEIDNARNWEIWEWNNGWSLLATGSSAALNTGAATNSIAIERNGSSIRAYANGTLVTSINDSTFTGPLNVGVWATSFDEPNLDVRYDNYKVEPIGCGLSASAPLGPWPFDGPVPDLPPRPEILEIDLPQRDP